MDSARRSFFPVAVVWALLFVACAACGWSPRPTGMQDLEAALQQIAG